MFKEVGENYIHICFFMCGHISEGCKAIINSFDLEGRKLGFFFMIYPFEWLDSFKTNVAITFSSQYKAISVLFFFFNEKTNR